MHERIIGTRNEAVESPAIRNVAELIFGTSKPGDGEMPILLGCSRPPDLRPVEVTLDQLRAQVLQLWERFASLDIRPGATVALLRFPRTDETITAQVYLALSALGVRVLFPMYLEMDALEDWLERCEVDQVVGAFREVRHGSHPDDITVLERVMEICTGRGLPVRCFDDDLQASAAAAAPDSPWLEHPEVMAAIEQTSLDTESLLLTTSGSSGKAKLVRYTQGGYLRSCAAWEEAGFFEPDVLGGRSLCLLLGHSMGLRSLWNAVWSRVPVCLITPEWFIEYPERVRSLLLKMQPQHVTGGPAVFDTVLELLRVYPDLKALFSRTFQGAVSSGAPYNPELKSRVERILGVRLHNALGLTETMQVACTLLGGEPPGLGAPLPGVRFRLVQEEGLPPDAWRLTIDAPFGFFGYLGREDEGPWFDTGDLVRIQDDGTLMYLGRERWDYLNDGLGVKISRLRLQQVYAPLPEGVRDIDFVALHNEPGLGAVFFLGAREGSDPLVPVDDGPVIHRLRAALEHRLDKMRTDLEEFEMRHLSVGRFVALEADVERTRKGNVAWARMQERYQQAIAALRARPRGQAGVHTVDRMPYALSTPTRMTSPHRGALLELFGLDKHYERGAGDALFYEENGQEHRVWDFVGGFGANLLGHAHPRVTAARQRAAATTVPLLDQGSSRVEQGELAAKLARLIGDVTDQSYVVRFGSTGAEAVEMALAHATLERERLWKRLLRDQRRAFGGRAPEQLRDVLARAEAAFRATRPRLIALEGAFHGYTSAARSALGRRADRTPFEPLFGTDALFVDPKEPAAIAALLDSLAVDVPCLAEEDGEIVESTLRLSGVLAALIEPIQGEGGIHPVPTETLAALSGQGFPLIADEIQAGLGRAGKWVASHPVDPDYLLLGKSLGGGVAKLSALLVQRHRYVARFDELYAGTFSADPASSIVAAEVVDVLLEDDICSRASERGEALGAALNAVREAFPQVVADVRGAGLMWGFELDRNAVQDSFLLRAVEGRDLLGALAASYLLNRAGLRVFPTLSAPTTLRIEPSAYVEDEAIAALEQGLRAFCQAVVDGRVVDLLSFLAEAEQGLTVDSSLRVPVPPWSSTLQPPAPGARRIGFINHFVLPERELVMAEPSLKELSMAARRNLFERMLHLMQLRPILGFSRHLFDGRLWFVSIPIVADAATLEDLHRRKKPKRIVERLQQAVDLGASMGCEAITLGGYTSILTRDGDALLPPEGCRLSSGNTFAVVVQAQRIRDACQRHGIDPRGDDTRVAIIGATGNIGSALAGLLSQEFSRLLLIAPRLERLNEVAEELRAHGSASIEVAADQSSVSECNIVAVAVNTNDPLLFPKHLARDREVLVADVSQPSVVARGVRKLANVTVLEQAGTAVLPHPADRDLVLSSHTPPGSVFCCAAEVMLMGLEPEQTASRRLTGPISLDNVAALAALGEAHGLLADTEGLEMGFRT